MKMKHAILAACAAAMVLATAGPAMAKELIFGSFLPPRHNVNVLGLAPVLKAIEKETGGSIKWKLLTAGQLFGGRATLTSVGGGLADAGVVIASFTQSKLPNFFTMTDMTMFASDGLVAAAAAADTTFNDCPQCLNDFHKQKTVPLGFYGLTPYKLMCNKKVTNLAEAKGMRMRTSGGNGRWARAMGGTPVHMTAPDMVEAIERGQIDCIIGPTAWIKAYSIPEHIKYVLDFPMGTFVGAAQFVMNRKVWQGLTLAEKKATLKYMPMSSALASIDGYAADAVKAEAESKARGAVYTKGGAEIEGLLKKHLSNEMDVIIAAAKKRRAKNPEAIIAAFKKNADKWTKLIAATDRSSESYRKLLWDHLYSKIDPNKL